MDFSRLFIRGLPPSLTADEFRQHFSKQCDITDAKIIPHRRIGYVGYKNNSDAARAMKYFNRSFIRMSKITVEPARSVEDQSLLTTSNNAACGNIKFLTAVPQRNTESSNQRKRKRESGVIGKENQKLQDYLKVMQPPSKSKIWSNEDSIGTRSIQLAPESRMKERTDDSKDEELEHMPEKNEFSINVGSKEAAQKTDPKSNQMPSVLPNVNPGTIDKVLSTDPIPASTSDADWLRLRTNRLLDLPGTDELLNDVIASSKYGSEQPESCKKTSTTLVSNTGTQSGINLNGKNLIEGGPCKLGEADEVPSRRLFVRNLSYATTSKDLREYLESQGQTSIEEIHIPSDFRTRNSKGFAYIQYNSPKAAKAGLDTLDGRPFQGRLLHVIPAMEKRHTELDEFAISKLPLKIQQQIKRKAEASLSSFSWNSLYMNSNAVLSSISDRLGISKSELLDPTSSTAAIKQAHAETHVIQETKAYFAANGVNLDAFKIEERSETAILIKNFSYGTRPEELKSLFEPYGTVLKILMPPSGTISIVEFEHPEHARSAFKSLAYRKFKDSILFLEKAPKTLFSHEKSKPDGCFSKAVPSHDKKITIEQLHEDETQRNEVDTSTLFVKNLNFSTTSDRLRETFEALEGFASARVKMKPNPKIPGQFLSMGFGFLEFFSKRQAQAALAAMDGYKLDGHELLLRASHKSVDVAEERRKEDQAKKAAGRRTKIIIKNLPFEATKKDVRSLFSAYGQLRSVRVPLKFDNSSRGFAFADFVTVREAENAMAALKNTHLLGRRLALDFAAEDAVDPEKEIENMQKKVGNQANKVALQKLASTDRHKFNVEGNEDVDMIR